MRPLPRKHIETWHVFQSGSAWDNGNSFDQFIGFPVEWPKIVEFAILPRGTGQVEGRLKLRPDQQTINRAFDELLENLRCKSVVSTMAI